MTSKPIGPARDFSITRFFLPGTCAMGVSRWIVWMDPQCPGSLTYAFEQLEQISTSPFGDVLRVYFCMGRHHILQSTKAWRKERQVGAEWQIEVEVKQTCGFNMVERRTKMPSA